MPVKNNKRFMYMNVSDGVQSSTESLSLSKSLFNVAEAEAIAIVIRHLYRRCVPLKNMVVLTFYKGNFF